jgi:hypothetical protein
MGLNFTFSSDSFTNTAVFSNAINVFGLTELMQWSIFYMLIFNAILYLIAKQYTINSIWGLLWLFGTFGFLNIYVFNLSKDIFQLCAFLLVFLVLREQNTKMLTKMLVVVGIMLLWGMIFRVYYTLIACYIIMTYVLMQHTWKSKRLLATVTIVLVGLLASFVLIEFLRPNDYHAILTARSHIVDVRYGSEDAETTMLDVFRNTGNPFILLANELITIVKLLVPIELFSIGLKPQYFVFFGYQMIVTTFYINSLRILSRKQSGVPTHTYTSDAQRLALFVFTGFLIGSALFEPDYGSWIRHESAVAPIIFVMFWQEKRDKSIIATSYTTAALNESRQTSDT